MTSQLVGFQEQSADAGVPFQIIMVNDDNNEAAMHAYARSSGINFPMIRFDSKKDETVAAMIGDPGELPLPAVLVLSPDGETVTTDLQQALEKVEQTLAEG